MFFASWCVFYDCYIINRPISIVITFKLIYSCWPIPINDKATYCSILRLPHDKKMSYVFYLEHGSPVKTLWISRTSTAVIISISMVTNLHLHLLIDCTFDINSKSLNKTKQIFQQKTVPTDPRQLWRLISVIITHILPSLFKERKHLIYNFIMISGNV